MRWCLAVLLTAALALGAAGMPSPAPLRFAQDGRFKVALFADLHYGENAWTDWGPAQDDGSDRVMEAVLDAERPDFVVYLGDLVTANNVPIPNATLYWDRAFSPTRSRGIPWATIFGNHDDMPFEWPPEWFSPAGVPPVHCPPPSTMPSSGCSFRGTPRMELMTAEINRDGAGLSRSSLGPQELWPGVSNYVLQVLSQEEREDPALLMYFLDSGGGSYPEVISGAQVRWFQSQSQFLNPDGRIPELIFWHIPSTAYTKVAPKAKSKIRRPCVGSLNMEDVAPQEAEWGMMDALAKRPSVKAIFVGHNHGLDWCCPYDELWLCFARHTGHGGYGDWPRGARVVEMSEKPFSVKSWIRMENGSTHSHIVLDLGDEFSYKSWSFKYVNQIVSARLSFPLDGDAMTTNNLPEELHLEILKHLSPSPKVLARASAVCREWRRVLNDPAFLLELYRTRRGAPVTQGYFDNLPRRFVHVNAGDPVRIPLDSIDHRTNWQFVDCRHGRVLLRDRSGLQFMVWQPMTGDQHFVQDKGSCGIQNSVALICECAAEGGDDGPKVGQAKPCHASHFRVAVVSNHVGTGRLHGVVFSSVTRLWSESAELPPTYQIRPEPSVVVGRMIYQPLFDYHILAFDTDKLRLTTFERPKWGNIRLLNVDGDVLGLVGALGFRLRLWVRYADAWVMRNTIDLSNIHPPLSTAPLPKTNPRFALMPPVKIIGVADGGDELFLWTMIGVFMLSVESMELKKVNGTTIHHMKTVYPYGAFYIPPSTVHPKIAT